MRTFAVILAAVAALAATSQAYLIWNDRNDSEGDRIRSERVHACKAIIGALAELHRRTLDPETFIRNAIAHAEETSRMYADDDDYGERQVPDEVRRELVEAQLLYAMYSPAVALQEFLDVNAIFFSESENQKIGLEELEQAVVGVDMYAGYAQSSEVPFEERINRFRQAAERLPFVKEVCLPILVNDEGR